MTISSLFTRARCRLPASNPMRGRKSIPDSAKLAHIFDRAEKKESGCWEYPGWRNATGHVNIYHRTQKWLVHRFVWTLVKGEIPKGMCVCHRCDNPPCCNPDHLWIGTTADNNRDMHSKGRSNYSKTRKTHCIRGHEFTPENTYIVPKHGFRRCRTCDHGRYSRPKFERPPLTKLQARQRAYRIRRKQRLAGAVAST